MIAVIIKYLMEELIPSLVYTKYELVPTYNPLSRLQKMMLPYWLYGEISLLLSPTVELVITAYKEFFNILLNL